jgi:hypothetical protein
MFGNCLWNSAKKLDKARVTGDKADRPDMSSQSSEI